MTVNFSLSVVTERQVHGQTPGQSDGQLGIGFTNFLVSAFKLYFNLYSLVNLASTSINLMHIHILSLNKTMLKTFGDRAFAKAGPSLWNELPVDIRKASSVETFKSQLKTFLFKKAFRV